MPPRILAGRRLGKAYQFFLKHRLPSALRTADRMLRDLVLCNDARLAADGLWTSEAAAWDGAHPGAAGYQRMAELVAAHPAWRAFTKAGLT